MHSTYKFLFITLALMLVSSTVTASPVIHHQMQIRLLPEQSKIEVVDTITLPEASNKQDWSFRLHKQMEPSIEGGKINAQLFSRGTHRNYALDLPEGKKTFTLKYTGSITHKLSSRQEGIGKQQQDTLGIISPEGVFLDAGSAWYPYFANSLQTFDLSIDIPENWTVISQGDGPLKTEAEEGIRMQWIESQPQDDIYLIAAPFHTYEKSFGEIKTQVYLRQEDSELAERYLAATAQYIGLYNHILGPYPYAKFALVENFWETGFGMPSFTLLGSRVIRLPFILTSSYPHEILHNWWGNSVYVDYASGNWSEGLTTYLADFLLQEQKGKGTAYRRTALQRYAEYVKQTEDFPLSEFRSRHDLTSQAVGYGKAMMMFHMLRRKLGDDIFIHGLRKFYQDNKFKRVGYTQLQTAFEAASQTSLGTFFDQWTQSTGAPTLSVNTISVTPTDDENYSLTAKLHQTQKESVFNLTVHLIVYREGKLPPVQTSIELNQRSMQINLTMKGQPLRLDIDPAFDLFRRIDPLEAPPALSALFGSEEGLLILPSKAEPEILAAYKKLAKNWTSGYPGLSIVMDSDIKQLPCGAPLWVLGWNNIYREQVNQTLTGKLHINMTTEADGEKNNDLSNSSLVLASRLNDTSQTPVAWIGSNSTQAIAGLSRKLPHYGKYSYLIFQGDEPRIQEKGHWKVDQSPLKIRLGDGDITTQVKEPIPLTAAVPQKKAGTEK